MTPGVRGRHHAIPLTLQQPSTLQYYLLEATKTLKTEINITLDMSNTITSTNFKFPGQKSIYKGKLKCQIQGFE